MSRIDESQKLTAHNRREFRGLFYRTMRHGVEVKPRSMLIKELLDTQIRIYPEYPFQDFEARRYNYEYFKREMRWKLGASKYDESIKQHAKMWESVQNPDGTFNSNYGQFWFGQQMGLMKAVLELVRDKHSRRASIPMLRDEHLAPEVRDTVCTEAVTFHIRKGFLYMSVHMRSSDQIFGLGTDVPTFSTLLMLALGLLRPHYPELQAGQICLTAASSHIYMTHFDMVEKILEAGDKPELSIRLPEPACYEECVRIIADRGVTGADIGDWPLYRFIYGGGE